MESIPWTDKKGNPVSEFVYIPIMKNGNNKHRRFTFIKVELTTQSRDNNELEYEKDKTKAFPLVKWREDKNNKKVAFDQGLDLDVVGEKQYTFNDEEIAQLNAYFQELLNILQAQKGISC